MTHLKNWIQSRLRSAELCEIGRFGAYQTKLVNYQHGSGSRFGTQMVKPFPTQIFLFEAPLARFQSPNP